MSLLIKALEQAAKDREAAAKLDAVPDAPGGEAAPDAAQRRTAKSLSGLARIEQQQRARSAALAQPGDSSGSKLFDYLRNSPVAMIGALAAVVGVAFGIYVYIQVAHPTLFTRTPAPAPSPQTPFPASPSAAAPAAPAPAAPPLEATVMTPAAPVPPTSTPVPTKDVIAAAAPAPAPASAPAGPATSASAVSPLPPEKASLDKALQPAKPPIPTAAVVGAPVSDRGELQRETAPEAPRAAKVGAGPPAQAAPPRERIVVSTGTPKPVLNPNLTTAYSAMQAGDLDHARKLYTSVAQSEPLNIDALLGLAYIAVQENRADEAMKSYLRILQLEPRNPVAQAAMIGLIGRADAVAAETRLKQLIAREPSPFLHFILGNIYSDQGAWPQAQQAYFQAHHLEPDNPDYAYNLAVSLDHLKQRKLAHGYYTKAEQLATARGRANFNVAQARERIRSLSSQLE